MRKQQRIPLNIQEKERITRGYEIADMYNLLLNNTTDERLLIERIEAKEIFYKAVHHKEFNHEEFGIVFS